MTTTTTHRPMAAAPTSSCPKDVIEQLRAKFPGAIEAADEVWHLENSNLGASLRGAWEAGYRGEAVYDFAHAYCAALRALPPSPDLEDVFAGFPDLRGEDA
jgi:hypothetical protein